MQKKKRKLKFKTEKVKITSKVGSELIAIVIIAIGLLSFVFFNVKATGSLGEQINSVFLGILGNGIFVIPFVLVFIGIHMIIKRDINKYLYRYITASFFPLLISVIINLIVFKDTQTENILDFYKFGLARKGGGFLAALITEPFVSVIGFF